MCINAVGIIFVFVQYEYEMFNFPRELIHWWDGLIWYGPGWSIAYLYL